MQFVHWRYSARRWKYTFAKRLLKERKRRSLLYGGITPLQFVTRRDRESKTVESHLCYLLPLETDKDGRIITQVVADI